MLTIDFSVQTATSLLVSINLINAAGNQCNFLRFPQGETFPLSILLQKMSGSVFKSGGSWSTGEKLEGPQKIRGKMRSKNEIHRIIPVNKSMNFVEDILDCSDVQQMWRSPEQKYVIKSFADELSWRYFHMVLQSKHGSGFPILRTVWVG